MSITPESRQIKYYMYLNHFPERVRDMMEDMLDSIDKLEEKVFKLGRKPTTLKQQILLLEKLGVLKHFRDLKITEESKAQLLAILLNGDFHNTKTFFRLVNVEYDSVKTVDNFKFLVDTFSEVKLNDKAKTAEKELNKIIREQEKKKNKK